MSWGKGLVVFLGLMLLSYVAHARDIESFTDSQGTLHITNAGGKQQGSPANPPSPAAPPRPSSFPPKAHIASPARETAPQAQAPVPNPVAPPPVPQPEAAPAGPVPVDPQPGSRIIHPESSGGVKPLADQTWKNMLLVSIPPGLSHGNRPLPVSSMRFCPGGSFGTSSRA
jgi:hypothetical protein